MKELFRLLSRTTKTNHKNLSHDFCVEIKSGTSQIEERVLTIRPRRQAKPERKQNFKRVGYALGFTNISKLFFMPHLWRLRQQGTQGNEGNNGHICNNGTQCHCCNNMARVHRFNNVAQDYCCNNAKQVHCCNNMNQATVEAIRIKRTRENYATICFNNVMKDATDRISGPIGSSSLTLEYKRPENKPRKSSIERWELNQ